MFTFVGSIKLKVSSNEASSIYHSCVNMAEFNFPILSIRKQAQDLDIPQFLWKDVSDKQEVNGSSFGIVYYGKYNG